jgi:type VI secretion system VasD/TssJ family lipoprotein
MAAALLLAGAACSHAPPAPPPPCTAPEPLRVLLRAGERLNPGENGEALATVVRLYQLKGGKKASEVGIDELLEKDKEALGEDLSEVKEWTINPSQRLDLALKRGEGVTHIMMAAFFRQPAGGAWRITYQLPAPDPDHCHPKAGARKSPAYVQFVLDENRVETRS